MSGMTSGIIHANLDPSIRPQDDLFGYTNGTWLAQTEIPADRGRYGTFDRLREQAEHHLRDILDEAVAANAPADTSRGRVARLYGAFMDEAAVQAAGLGRVTDLLADVDDVTDAADLLALTGRLERIGMGGAIHHFVNTDDRDSSRYVTDRKSVV